MTEHSIRYKLKDDDQVLFLHIPKAAGTTFIHILENRFYAKDVCKLGFGRDIIQLSPKALAKYKFFRGHIYYDAMCKILPKKPVCLTLLRDPVERSISHYMQLANEPESHPYPTREAHNLSLAEFVNNIKLNAGITNFQARLLASKLGNFENVDDFVAAMKADADRAQSTPWLDIELVKERLKEFAFFGLVERFQDSLALLSYTFSWPPVVHFQNYNITSNRLYRKQIPQDILDKILELNQLDIELYQYAQQLFDERYSIMMQELLKANYENYSPALKKRVHSLYVKFDDPLPGSGWHMADITPAQEVIRWSGPDTLSTLYFPLLTDIDLVIQFSIVHVLALDILDSLELMVNYDPIMLTRDRKENGEIVFEGKIPQSSLANNQGATRLTFQVNRTISPREVDPSNPDQRQLGLAFRWLKIFPAAYNTPSC